MRNLLLLICVLVSPDAFGVVCFSCKRTLPPNEEYLPAVSPVTGSARPLCRDCLQIDKKCFICRAPVKVGGLTSPDGRLFCEEDAKGAIFDASDGRKVFDEAAQKLQRLLSQFLTLPGNIEVEFINTEQPPVRSLRPDEVLDKVIKSDFSAAAIRRQGTNRFTVISIMTGIKQSWVRRMSAQHLMFAWMAANISPNRALDPNVETAFANLIACKLLDEWNETEEKSRLLERIARKETIPQLNLMRSVESTYGLGTLLEWLRFGVDAQLTSQDLDRVRVLKPRHAEINLVPAGASEGMRPVLVPDRLILKGILGTPARPLALINNTTFERNERARVNIGTSNVFLRCLEIRKQSVLIQLEGGSEKQELRLVDPKRVP